MNALTTDPLTPEQRARVEALHAAAAVLTAAPPTVALLPAEIVDVAAYVIDARIPDALYDGGPR